MITERLMIRRRGGRKRALGTRATLTLPQLPNNRWSVHFVADQLIERSRLRVLVVVEDCTRECRVRPLLSDYEHPFGLAAAIYWRIDMNELVIVGDAWELVDDRSFALRSPN
jgi:hypothetical protein